MSREAQIKSPEIKISVADKNFSVCETCKQKFIAKFPKQKLCFECWKKEQHSMSNDLMLRCNALNNAHKFLELKLYVSDEIKVNKTEVKALVKTYEEYLKTGKL